MASSSAADSRSCSTTCMYVGVALGLLREAEANLRVKEGRAEPIALPDNLACHTAALSRLVSIVTLPSAAVRSADNSRTSSRLIEANC
jgi:hypothetical protein